LTIHKNTQIITFGNNVITKKPEIMMNDYFKSYLQYKVLDHRFSSVLPGGGNTIDAMLKGFESKVLTDVNGNQVEEIYINEALQLQNVCAKLTLPLVRRMESIIDVLSMSKREFIEIAIITALEESERIMVENDVQIPVYESQKEGESE
jgi:hypothetical protein